MRILHTILIGAVAATPIAAHAAEIQTVNDAIVYRGPVLMGDAARFTLNLQAARNRGEPGSSSPPTNRACRPTGP